MYKKFITSFNVNVGRLKKLKTMKKVKRKFVTLYYRGVMFDEPCTRSVASDEAAHEMALKDKNCFGYDLWQREDVEEDGTTYTGEPETYKSVIFGKVYTLEEVEKMENVDILLFNMRSNGDNNVVKTRCGNWKPYKENVQYISE